MTELNKNVVFSSDKLGQGGLIMAKRAVVFRKSWKSEAEKLAREVEHLKGLLTERDQLISEDQAEIKDLKSKVAHLEDELRVQKEDTKNAERIASNWKRDFSRKYDEWYELIYQVRDLEEKVRQLRKVGQVFAGMSLSADASYVEVLGEFRKRVNLLGLRGIAPSVLEEVVKGGQRQITKLVFSVDHQSGSSLSGEDPEVQKIMNEIAKTISGGLRP